MKTKKNIVFRLPKRCATSFLEYTPKGYIDLFADNKRFEKRLHLLDDDILFREYMINFRGLDDKHEKKITAYLDKVLAELAKRGKEVKFSKDGAYAFLSIIRKR